MEYKRIGPRPGINYDPKFTLKALQREGRLLDNEPDPKLPIQPTGFYNSEGIALPYPTRKKYSEDEEAMGN